MKYFLDTEFLEGPQKEKFPISLFRKYTPNTIDLISIGIVSYDGREYYAISKDFNLKEAWNRFDLKPDIKNGGMKKVYWIRENVLKPIWKDLFFQADDCSGLSNKQTETFYQGVLSGEYDHYFTLKSMKALIAKYGKTNKQIAEEVKKFCIQYTKEKPFLITKEYGELSEIKKDYPKFYAYYADYDWVVFCWLFGKMIDLPEGFPMYCRDLKQMLDEKPLTFKPTIAEFTNKYVAGIDPYYEKLEQHVDFPKQENEHSAIHDARWNKKLYEFLNSL